MKTHVYAYSISAVYLVLLAILWQRTDVTATDLRYLAAWLGPLVWVYIRHIRLFFLPRDHRGPKMTLILTLNESLVVPLALIVPPVAVMTMLLAIDVRRAVMPSRRRNRLITTLGLAVHSCAWEGIGILGARALGDRITSSWSGVAGPMFAAAAGVLVLVTMTGFAQNLVGSLVLRRPMVQLRAMLETLTLTPLQVMCAAMVMLAYRLSEPVAIGAAIVLCLLTSIHRSVMGDGCGAAVDVRGRRR